MINLSKLDMKFFNGPSRPLFLLFSEISKRTILQQINVKIQHLVQGVELITSRIWVYSDNHWPGLPPLTLKVASFHNSLNFSDQTEIQTRITRVKNDHKTYPALTFPKVVNDKTFFMIKYALSSAIGSYCPIGGRNVFRLKFYWPLVASTYYSDLMFCLSSSSTNLSVKFCFSKTTTFQGDWST